MRSCSGFPTGRRAGTWLTLVGVLLGLASWTIESAPETVKITVPAAVGFAVTNVSANTTGSPSATTVSFAQLTVNAGRVLRMSIKADSNFIPPSGTAIPASKVSWTTTGAANGTGSSGVLSTSAYNQVFVSDIGKKAGGVDLHWTLAAPGTPLRAGNHTVIVRWKLESF